MIVPDVDFLVYAYNDGDHQRHTDFARFPGLRWRNPLT